MTTYPIHFRDRTRANLPTCDAVLVQTSSDWSEVTCGNCLLEQPAQKVAGRVEYTVPADVLARDAALAAGDRRARALAAVAEVREQAQREVEAWSAIAADAASLAARLAALPLPGVDAGTGQGEASEPAEERSERRYPIWEQMGITEQQWNERSAQHAPFAARVKAYRLNHQVGLLEGKRAVIDADHEEALFWNEFDRWADGPGTWIDKLGRRLSF